MNLFNKKYITLVVSLFILDGCCCTMPEKHSIYKTFHLNENKQQIITFYSDNIEVSFLVDNTEYMLVTNVGELDCDVGIVLENESIINYKSIKNTISKKIYLKKDNIIEDIYTTCS
jgi:hypothetical protein